MPLLQALAAAVTLAGLSVLVGAASSAVPSSAVRPSEPVVQARSSAGAAQAPAGASGDGRVDPPSVPTRQPAPARSGYRWPVAGRPAVLRHFVVGPQRWSPGHRGVDLAAAVGDHVLAAGPGVVSFAGTVAGRGVVAVLHADGMRTTYEPVTATVSAGDPVDAGTPLGLLAAGGHCTAGCLHWGALRRDTYLDPLSLLAPPRPPVLLPLGGNGAATARQ